MRSFINYIRSCFCKHDWELIFDTTLVNRSNIIIGHRKTYRCKKCGYSKYYTSQ